jgi:hypothetical protein
MINMKQTQVIYLLFDEGTSTTRQKVSVPFTVKTVHTKAMSVQMGDVTAVNKYITVESDLVNNQSMGSFINNHTYPAGTNQNVKCLLWNPQVIQGEYTFTIKQSNGVLYPASANGDDIALIVEYSSPDELS